jgi:hypothetical protein
MTDTERGRDEEAPLAIARLIIGVVQGYALWALFELGKDNKWPETHPAMFGALLLAALATPPVLLSALGVLKTRSVAVWGLVSAVLAAAIGGYQGSLLLDSQGQFPTVPVVLAVGGVWFIAHNLLLAAAHDRKTIARYPTYFDFAWKHGLQLALAAAFTGVVWAVLGIGVLLFGVIGLKGFGEFVGKPWVAIPITTVAFAMAVHLTDVRVGLIRGVRTVALTLLGWLTPLLAALALAFLAALPFTGLELLWKTGSATTTLMGAAVTLVILLNAAYQDGDRATPLSRVLDIAIRLAGLLLTPLAGLAIYGLLLRINQHGLSVDRIIAAAGLVIISVYAVGYAIAAFLPGRPMQRLEPTNVANAFLTIAVVLALLSPLANPVRLSVDSQVSRLKAGKVKAGEFDFAYLRFETGRVGMDALKGLAKEKGEVGEKARAMLARENRYEPPEPTPLSATITVYPKGETLPPDFLSQPDGFSVRSCTDPDDKCDAFLVDLNGDGRQEIILGPPQTDPAFVFARDTKGAWGWIGSMDLSPCNQDIRPGLRQGKLSTVAPPWPDLMVNGVRVALLPDASCERPDPPSPAP